MNASALALAVVWAAKQKSSVHLAYFWDLLPAAAISLLVVPATYALTMVRGRRLIERARPPVRLFAASGRPAPPAPMLGCAAPPC